MRPSLAVSLLLSALVAPRPAPASRAADDAALLFGRGRYAEALARLDSQAIQSDASALLLRGLCLRRLGRDNEAVAPLREAWRRDPSLLDAGVSLGLALQGAGLWAEAGEAFRAAAARHPRSPQPHLGLGSLAAGLGRWAEACDEYRAATRLDPDNAKAWAALSDAWLRQGRLAEAAEARGRALALQPQDKELRLKQAAALYSLGQDAQAAALLEKSGLEDSAEAYFLAGCIAQRGGDLDKAGRQFKAALRERPDYPEAELNLGINAYSRGDYAEAGLHFGRIGPKQALYAQAQDYLRECSQAAVDQALRQGAEAVIAGDYLGAMGHWDRAEALASDKAAVHKMLASLREQQKPRAAQLAAEGSAAYKAGDLAQALLLWSDAQTVDPGNREAKAALKAARKDLDALRQAHVNAARQLAAQDDLAGARAWAKRLAVLDADAGRALRDELERLAEKRSDALAAAAAKATEAGKPEEALRLLDQALALAPDDAGLQARRRAAQSALRRDAGAKRAQSLVREAGGDLAGAYRLLQEALRLDPGDLQARRDAARLAERLDLKRLDPAAVDSLYYEGVYLYGAGETEKAMQLWTRALEADPQHGPARAAMRSAERKLQTLASLEKR